MFVNLEYLKQDQMKMNVDSPVLMTLSGETLHQHTFPQETFLPFSA